MVFHTHYSGKEIHILPNIHPRALMNLNVSFSCVKECLGEAVLVFAPEKSRSVKQKGWLEEVNFVKNFLNQFKVSSEGGPMLESLLLDQMLKHTSIPIQKGRNKVDVSHRLKLLESAWDDPFAQTMTHLALEKVVKMMRARIRNVQKIQDYHSH